ncbi:MAG: metallophosphoesterase [Acidobacteriota bacterium]
MRRLRPVVLLLLVLILCAGCRRQAPDGEIWFVHATDPHLFYGDRPELRQRQEPMNQQAFSDLVAALDDLPGKPSFLVVSGDFGLDLFAGEPVGVDGAVKLVAGILGKSPVKDIYLVPGNNDVKDEAPDGPEVAAFQLFWSRVQAQLQGTGVALHDLTSCYFGGGLSSCWADVPGTSYRLVGFPSQSFKDGVSPARSGVQLAQLDRLARLVEQAGPKRVLIVTHIAEIDDPYKLAQIRMRKGPDRQEWAPGRPEWSAASSWNVPKEVYARWKKIVDSPSVAGVLAGHFHDSHKEIYRRPYGWSTAPPERASPGKLYLAPPLSMRYQDTSPIQARGFALFRLKGGGAPERILYWYDARTRGFEPDSRSSSS